jgi:hypothetical protein
MNEYMRMADRMYDLENQMKQLEKENAELKELLKDKSCLDCKCLHSDLKLTKAKGIIKIMKHLLFDVWGYIDFPFEERVNKFLSEVEK